MGDGPPRYGPPIGSAEDSVKNKHRWSERCFVNEVSFPRLQLVREDWRQRPYWPTEAKIKRRYLRPILTGEHAWCQLFSEPGSGSDGWTINQSRA